MVDSSQAGDSVASPASSGATAKDGPTSPVGESITGKKRKAASGGRGVANLTPEQLAKKRANDREAQRNIRERTKAQIESLERTIEQLRSQQPYQELQRVMREKETVEAENVEIRRRLAAVLQLIQPIVTSQPGSSINTATSHAQPDLTHANEASIPSAVPRAGFHQEHFMPSAVGPLSAASTTYAMPWQQGATSGSPDSATAPTFAPRPRSPNGQPTLLGMASSIYRMTESEQEALNSIRLGENRPSNETRPVELVTRSSSVSSFPSLPSDVANSRNHPANDNLPIYQRLAYNGGPTCTLDSIILTYRADVEKRMRQGQSARHVLGSELPDWRYIRDPDSVPAGQENYVGGLSRFFGQVLSHRMFPDLQQPAEKVGSAYMLYTYMYWTLVQDEEAYVRVPPWLRPTEPQCKIAHGPWVDAMFWPEMRHKVLQNQLEYRFDELFIPLTRTVSCNWPHGNEAIFDAAAYLKGQMILSDRFMDHIFQLDNWTLGPEFAKTYPQLVGTYILKD